MKTLIKLSFGGVITLCLTLPSLATEITGAEFLLTQVSALVSAQGAGCADNQGSDSLNWNPAGLSGKPFPSVALTHFSGLLDTNYEQLAGFYPGFLGGNWASRFFYGSISNFPIIDLAGSTVKDIENYNALLHVAYARELWPGLSLGFGLKLFDSALAEFHSRGAAVDLGTRYQPKDSSWSIGAAVQNIGTKTAFIEETEALPLLLNCGAAYAWQLMPAHTLRILGDIAYPLVGDTAIQPVTGLEYNLRETAFIRGSYRWDNELGALALGAGIRWENLGLDYAFQPYGTLGGNHRLTLAYTFKTIAPIPKSTPQANVPLLIPKQSKELAGKTTQMIAKPTPKVSITRLVPKQKRGLKAKRPK